MRHLFELKLLEILSARLCSNKKPLLVTGPVRPVSSRNPMKHTHKTVVCGVSEDFKDRNVKIGKTSGKQRMGEISACWALHVRLLRYINLRRTYSSSEASNLDLSFRICKSQRVNNFGIFRNISRVKFSSCVNSTFCAQVSSLTFSHWLESSTLAANLIIGWTLL